MFRFSLDPETELRVLATRDADELFALTDGSRRSLRRWLPWVDATLSVEDSSAFIGEVRRQYAAENGFTAGIWHRGRLAGVIGYHAIDWRNHSTSLGYWLGEPFQGRGLKTRGCRALVDHALLDLRLNRVEIRCAVANQRSRAIPERLGFTLEGTLREAELLPDGYVDLAVYAMLARDWRAPGTDPR